MTGAGEVNRRDVVVVGAGQAGAEVAWSLRSLGFTGSVTVLGEEVHEPYQRPPLSKDVLAQYLSAADRPPAEGVEPGPLSLRSRAAYAERDVELVTGSRVVELDHAGRRLRTADGTEWQYTDCVLATGVRPRLPAVLEGCGGRVLRTLDDAVRLAGELSPGDRALIVGGGFLGLEIASSLSALGIRPTVVEMASRVLPGRVSAHTAEAFSRLHTSGGVELVLGESIRSATRTRGRGEVELRTSSGRTLRAEHLVVAAGAVADTSLARQAGADCGAGVLVDPGGATCVAHLYAVGDLASLRLDDGGEQRVESVQHAVAGARATAHALVGRGLPRTRAATFWSQQHGVRLQTAGFTDRGAPVEDVVEGDLDTSFVVRRYQDGRLAAVEAAGRPADFVRSVALLGKAAEAVR